jgi:alpha-1,6-mannosyltransferase
MLMHFIWARRKRRSLAAIGVATAFCYGLLVAYYASSLSTGAWWTALNTIAALLLIYLYREGWLAQREGPATLVLVLGFAAIFVLQALMLPSFHSKDLYCYVNIGWSQFRYGLNPYVHPAADVSDWRHDSMITPVWLYNPCPYGFLFARLTRWIAIVGHGRFRLTLLSFQIVNVIAYAIVAWLIMATRAHMRLSEDGSALYLFLWNPLVILLLLADGHNDMLMSLATVIAVYAGARDRWVLAIPLLSLGILIKYSTAIIIPFALIEMLFRRRIGELILSAAIAAGVFLWSAAPYIADYRHFQLAAIAANLFSTVNSLESVLYYPLQAAAGRIPALRAALPEVRGILIGLITLLGLTTLVIQIIRYAQRWSGSMHDFVANALFAQFLVSGVLATKFYPWYVGSFFPLALLLDDGYWLRNLTIFVSLSSLLTLTPIGQAHIINYLSMIGVPILWVTYYQRAEIARDLVGPVLPDRYGV